MPQECQGRSGSDLRRAGQEGGARVYPPFPADPVEQHPQPVAPVCSWETGRRTQKVKFQTLDMDCMYNDQQPGVHTRAWHYTWGIEQKSNCYVANTKPTLLAYIFKWQVAYYVCPAFPVIKFIVISLLQALLLGTSHAFLRIESFWKN